MNLFQKIKDLKKVVSDETLRKACNQLQLNVRFEHVRDILPDILIELAQTENSKSSFVFLGQQGLCKTIVARDVLTDFLYSIGRIQRQAFLKIEPYKLDKTNFEDEIKSKFIEGKGGLVFIDEVHNLREVETIFFQQLIFTVKHEGFQKTAFVISAGAPSWKKIKDKFLELPLLFPYEIYFEPYTDEQLAGILQLTIQDEGNAIQIPKNYSLENIIRQLRAVRQRQGQYFENASEVMFYYHQCLKRAAIYLQTDTLDEELERLSLKNFSSTVVRR